MYRATLIFSYSFSLSGYYTYFWYPIPLSQLCLGYFLSFSASIPFLPLRPGISCTFRPPYPSCRCARVFPILFGLHTLFPAAPRIFPALFGLYTLFPAAPWVFPILFGLHTFSAAAPWVFPALSGFSYPRNTEILCMSFSYNTQDSIGKRFPQPFL